jgi:hypothetical protein
MSPTLPRPTCRPSSLSLKLAVHLLLAGAWTAQAGAAATSVGLSPVREQTFGNEDLFFFQPAEYDRFGYSLAAGDFNNDGAMDLATGMPYDDGLIGSGLTDSGIVIVRWGVPGGGLASGLADTVLSQFAAGSQGDPDTNDRFGWTLAAGDFNGDGHDDLAVGVPKDEVPNPNPKACGADFVRAGSVVVHYGLPNGISTGGEHWVTAGALFPCGGADSDDFGHVVVAGDWNGDGYDDLAVGVPGKDFGSSAANSGAAFVFYGHFGGLVPFVGVYVSQAASAVDDVVETGDEFGYALASGDLNHDLLDDLAVGVPVVGESATNDRFGAAVALGDFDGDGFDDLAIGAPRADPGAPLLDSGRIAVVKGNASILTPPLATQLFTQGSLAGDPAANTSGDEFGYALAAADFDRDGREDLAVGKPRKFQAVSSNGGVTVLSGSSPGGLGGAWRNFFPGGEGVAPPAVPENTLGFALAAGDFDGNGHADLASGLPQRDESGQQELGRVLVLYGALFSDGFETANFTYWSAHSP